MKIVSYNVRSWTRDTSHTPKECFWKTRWNNIRKYLYELDADVICLQEADPPFGKMLIPEGYKKATHGVSHFIIVKKETVVIQSHFSIHYDWADIRINGVFYRIINVHSGFKDKAFTDLTAKLDELCCSPAIACGDFNRDFDAVKNSLFYYTVLKDGEDTFKNWKNGYSYSPDHFATYGLIAQLNGTEIDITESDHRPILMII